MRFPRGPTSREDRSPDRPFKAGPVLWDRTKNSGDVFWRAGMLRAMILGRSWPAAAATLLSLAPAPLVRADVLVSSGFESGSGVFWSGFVTQGSSFAFESPGGNPGTFADCTVSLASGTPAQAGMYAVSPQFSLISPQQLSTVVISADYRYFQGSGAELWPILVQQNAIFRPAQPIALPVTSNWTGTGTWNFPVSSFTNAGGVPFFPSFLTQIGFTVRVPAPVSGVSTVEVGIDNISLAAVPAPATCLAVFAAGGLTLRRRRTRAPARPAARCVHAAGPGVGNAQSLTFPASQWV